MRKEVVSGQWSVVSEKLCDKSRRDAIIVARHVSAGSQREQASSSMRDDIAAGHAVPARTPKFCYALFPALTCWATALSSLTGLFAGLFFPTVSKKRMNYSGFLRS